MGIMGSAFCLLGLGLGPIIATQLLGVLPSWRWVFVIVALPGFIVAYLFYKLIKEPIKSEKSAPANVPYKELLKYRNVLLGCFGVFGAMSNIFVISAMLPSYLTDYLGLSVASMGFVIAGIGFGGFVGNLVVPRLSDKIGRKPTIILTPIFAVIALLALLNTGAKPILLFVLVFILAGLSFGLLTMLAMVTPRTPFLRL